MAGELKINIEFIYSKSGVDVDWYEKSSFTVSGDQLLQNIQTIGTSEEAILLGDVAAGGYVMMKNLDDTNFVEIRQGTGKDDLIRLEPSDVTVFRLTDDATAPYAIADTGDCDVRYIVIDA